MHDGGDGGHERGGPRHERGHDQRHCGPGEERGRPAGDEHCGPDAGRRGDCNREPGGERRAPHGDGPDTRFLQLEMSQVLYAEAEAVTKQAFRELLIEAAKARFRERFGDQIVGLAQLAVDELMQDVRYSLDIEARIQERNRDRGHTKDRLRDIFAEHAPGGEHGSGHEESDAREGGSPRRENEGGEGGGGRDDNR